MTVILIAAQTQVFLARLAFLLLLIAFAVTRAVASPAVAAAENGMVVTAQHLATNVGIDVLKRGGNAVDAAVAVGYALAVVYPAAGNLGGGGFMTMRFADGRKTFIDFRETAPRGATANMFLDGTGKVIEGLSTRGHLAVAVPGTVAGLELARGKYGSLPRRVLLAPAIALAEKGFVLDQGDVDMLREATEDFKRDKPSAAIFLHRGRPFAVGDRLIQEDLARTLNAIGRQGTRGFYQGSVAIAIAAANRSGRGLITEADLDQYKPRELPPVECDYRGFHIVSAPPPSSGGVALCEMLNVLEGYSLKTLGFHSAQAVHYQIEAMRQAFVDRNLSLGDPDFVNNPIGALLDKGYAATIRDRISSAHARISRDLRPGIEPVPLHEGSNTTHYSIIDRWGNAVAVTYTLNDWFGARVTAAGTGVLLNNEMDDFTAKPGVANAFGLMQGAANAIAPGKRPLSSMSPTIVMRDNQPLLILGTPGGSRIITAVLQTIVHLIDYDMDIEQAVAAPRFHQQWLPEETSLERGTLTPDVRQQLQAMGHRFAPPHPANHIAAIMVGAPRIGGQPRGANRYYGFIDPRRNTGLAAGY